MKKLLTLMSGVVFTILLSISSMSQAQVLKKPTPTGVINAVDFSVDSYKVDLMDLSSLDPCQRAKAHAKRVLRKFSHSCSDAWEAAANLAVDEALEQCSGATDDFARCEINSYENYVHDICEGNPSDYSDYVDGLATRTTCRVLRGQS